MDRRTDQPVISSEERNLSFARLDPRLDDGRLWGFSNLVVGYLLICKVGTFELRRRQHVLVAGAGALWALMPITTCPTGRLLTYVNTNRRL